MGEKPVTWGDLAVQLQHRCMRCGAVTNLVKLFNYSNPRVTVGHNTEFALSKHNIMSQINREVVTSQRSHCGKLFN